MQFIKKGLVDKDIELGPRIGTKRALLFVCFGEQGGAVHSELCTVTVDAAFVVSV